MFSSPWAIFIDLGILVLDYRGTYQESTVIGPTAQVNDPALSHANSYDSPLDPLACHLNIEEQSLIPFLLKLSSLTPSNHLQPPASNSNPPGEDRAFQQTWPDQTIVFERILHLQRPPL